MYMTAGLRRAADSGMELNKICVSYFSLLLLFLLLLLYRHLQFKNENSSSHILPNSNSNQLH